jgi:hypothetical protein
MNVAHNAEEYYASLIIDEEKHKRLHLVRNINSPNVG